MPWVSCYCCGQTTTSNVRFAGFQQEKAQMLQGKQTGQSTQMRSSNATMSRDESMPLLKYYIKNLAVLGLNTAFSLTDHDLRGHPPLWLLRLQGSSRGNSIVSYLVPSQHPRLQVDVSRRT
jgi:hypothetical protein